MAVQQIGVNNKYDVKDYVGLSTDTKPLTCAEGSTFTEIDTGKVWTYGGTTNTGGASVNGWWFTCQLPRS